MQTIAQENAKLLIGQSISIKNIVIGSLDEEQNALRKRTKQLRTITIRVAVLSTSNSVKIIVLLLF